MQEGEKKMKTVIIIVNQQSGRTEKEELVTKIVDFFAQQIQVPIQKLDAVHKDNLLISKDKCNKCAYCIEVCPLEAIM